MDIAKIIGVGLITLIITLLLKDYRRDFAILTALVGGIIILFLSLDTLKRNNRVYR